MRPNRQTESTDKANHKELPDSIERSPEPNDPSQVSKSSPIGKSHELNFGHNSTSFFSNFNMNTPRSNNSFSRNSFMDSINSNHPDAAINHTANYTSMTTPLSNSASARKPRLVQRIRTPNDHDVLCGRGGGINSHPGNIKFRNWVRERKENYNLAPSKAAKASVSREIVDRVTGQDPPGRFLQREEMEKCQSGKGSSYWVEIDDTKAMAKTSQALREGAPAIRAKAQTDNGSTVTSNTQKKSKKLNITHAKPEHEQKRSPTFTGTHKTSRSESMELMTESEPLALRRKFTPQDEMELNNNNSSGAIFNTKPISTQRTQNKSHEGQLEDLAFSLSVPLLTTLPMVPTAPQANIDISGTLKKDKEKDFDCAVGSTPNLLPIPTPSDPTILTSFPLPSSFSSEPLPSVFSDKFPPLLTPSSSKKSLTRSHSLVLSDLPEPDSMNQSYLHQDKLLQEEYDQPTIDDDFFDEDDDPDFSDLFEIERFLEGIPDFSPKGIHVASKTLNYKIESKAKALMMGLSLASMNSTSMSQLFPSDTGNDNSRSNKNNTDEKNSVCFCLCDGRDGACKELCPCNHFANSLLTGELDI